MLKYAFVHVYIIRARQGDEYKFSARVPYEQKVEGKFEVIMTVNVFILPAQLRDMREFFKRILINSILLKVTLSFPSW